MASAHRSRSNVAWQPSLDGCLSFVAGQCLGAAELLTGVCGELRGALLPACLITLGYLYGVAHATSIFFSPVGPPGLPHRPGGASAPGRPPNGLHGVDPARGIDFIEVFGSTCAP